MKHISLVKYWNGYQYFLYDDIKYRMKGYIELTIQINNAMKEFDRGTAGSFKCRYFFRTKKLFHNSGYQNKTAREFNEQKMQKMPPIFFNING